MVQCVGAVGTASILRPLLAREILGEEDFGAKSGALAVMFFSATAAAPYGGALIWARGGYDAMLATGAGVAVLGAALYLLARRGA